MLNKSARMLMHYSSESDGVNIKEKTNTCRLFFHQVNQSSGKIYRKHPIIKRDKISVTIESITYQMPSQYLIDAYEKKKQDYLLESIKGYSLKINEINEKDKPVDPSELKELTEIQSEVYELLKEGSNQNEIAEKLSRSQPAVSKTIKIIKDSGYITDFT
jgi:hypothetical protein